MTGDTFRIVVTVGLVLIVLALYQIARLLGSIADGIEALRARLAPDEDDEEEVT